MNDIATRLEQVRQGIRDACDAAGRDPTGVRLLAVSKTKSADAIRAAIDAGQVDFGENYLQEAVTKIESLTDAKTLCWHYIGAIQSNKTRDIATHFDWVHSVASSKVARRLNDHALKLRAPERTRLQILLQVNISGESSKSGIRPDELNDLVAAALTLPNIELRGLMAIPEATDDHATQHANFATLRELRDQLATSFGMERFDQLSMGMTNDYPAAIMEGATWIRVGTAIFGPRQ